MQRQIARLKHLLQGPPRAFRSRLARWWHGRRMPATDEQRRLRAERRRERMFTAFLIVLIVSLGWLEMTVIHNALFNVQTSI